MPPVLSVERVRKSFGGVAAVNDVSLALEPGRIYGLIGPNGSGKTTLFNCITGIERLDAGRVSFRGERIDGLKPWQIARRGIGRTFQIIRVFPGLTALENLLVVTRGARAEAEDRKSTRLNSSHQIISYAVFCLKKKTCGWVSSFSYLV